jgi:hypothetical protein
MYEFNGYPILDKMFEAKDVAKDAVATKDYVIPSGETWNIKLFGGSTSATIAEVEFKFSPDGGDTWLNPYDGTNDIIRCIHIVRGSWVGQPAVALEFQGDGENTIIRIQVKNVSEAAAEEIVGWFNGWVNN